MSESNNKEIQSINLKGYIWVLVIFWTIFVVSILLWNWLDEKREVLDLVRIAARSAFQKDLIYRRWAAEHGGVYVPTTEQTPPNPYLSHIEERDITTPSGRSLTLINPAYMTRQVHELGLREYGLRGHITSLNLLRPENAPDSWEKESLEAFEQGATEVSSIEQIDGDAYMRVMRPLVVEQGCLKCHAKQGYKLGDIRGGISVAVPMAPWWNVVRSHSVVSVMRFSMLWLLGMGGIGLGSQKLRIRIQKQVRAEQKVIEDREQLKSLASQLSITEDRERRRIATELHDQIGQSLVFSKIKLDELRQSATSSELTKALDEICTNIGQIIQDTRTLTFDLSSPILNELGLEAAVAEWLDVQIGAKHGIETEFVDDGQQKPLDDDIRALLFRNVRELLVNVIKHAQAQMVKVSIRRVNEHIHIEVEDDGKGFDSVKVISTAIEDTKFGLFSIRQRLEQLGGQFEIDSEPGRGSKFSMMVPIKRT